MASSCGSTVQKVGGGEVAVGVKRNAAALHPTTQDFLARGQAMPPTQGTGVSRVIRSDTIVTVRLVYGDCVSSAVGLSELGLCG